VIKLAAAGDHRLLIDGPRVWAETVPNIEIAVVTATAGELPLDSPELVRRGVAQPVVAR
jgi:hypothetical protein